MRLLFAACLLLSGCTPALTPVAQQVAQQQTAARAQIAQAPSEGFASWYGPGFAGRRTASGEVFDPTQLTAAHRTLPFGTQLRVTNLANGRSVVVRINDRGPFKPGRIIDLSRAAAEQLGMIGSGTAQVRLELLTGGQSTLLAALDRSLTGYSVSSSRFAVGELLLLSAEGVERPLLARVVSNAVPESAGVDLYLSPTLYAELGEHVVVLNP